MKLVSVVVVVVVVVYDSSIVLTTKSSWSKDDVPNKYIVWVEPGEREKQKI